MPSSSCTVIPEVSRPCEGSSAQPARVSTTAAPTAAERYRPVLPPVPPTGSPTAHTVSEFTGQLGQRAEPLSPVLSGVEQPSYERRADDHTVGVGGYVCGLVRVGDSESDPEGQVCDRAGTLDQRAGEVAAGLTCPGDAHDGGGVDESTTTPHRHRHPCIGRGGCHQEDLVEVLLVGCGDPFGCLP